MKTLGFGMVMALAVASGLVYGQDPRGQSGDDKAVPQRSSQAGQPAHADAQGFVNDMTIAGLAEVQLGKMASERSSNADVKAFGQMMVKDHSQANNELKQVASALGIQPAAQLDQKHKDLADRLSKLQGAEFDREYINAMVQGHQEVLGKLRARAEAALPPHGAAAGGRSAEPSPEKGLPSTTTNSNKPVAQDPAIAKSQAGKGATTTHGQGDEAVTQWVAKAIPKVQTHLDHAKEIQQKLAK